MAVKNKLTGEDLVLKKKELKPAPISSDLVAIINCCHQKVKSSNDNIDNLLPKKFVCKSSVSHVTPEMEQILNRQSSVMEALTINDKDLDISLDHSEADAKGNEHIDAHVSATRGHYRGFKIQARFKWVCQEMMKSFQKHPKKVPW